MVVRLSSLKEPHESADLDYYVVFASEPLCLI